MIKVSAVISTYNSEKFIHGCIEDLLEQSLYKNGELEIIVIDSCSQQNEKLIVKKFQKKYRNIIYKRTSVRESMYVAWNRGIKIANGLYITNANTDDRHHADSLKVQSDYLDAHKNIDLVYTDCYVTDIENEKFHENNHKNRYFYPKYIGQESLLMYQFGIHPTWRKEIHKKIGFFPENISIAGDYWLNLQIASYCSAHHINKVLGLYLTRKEALSYKDDRIIKETMLLRNEYRKEENLIRIYRNTKQFKNNPLTKIYYDMALKSIKYFPAWLSKTSESDLDFSLNCLLNSISLDKTSIKKHVFFVRTLYQMLFNLKLLKLKFIILKKYCKRYLKSLLENKRIVFLHPYDISVNGANGGGANSTISLAEKIAGTGYEVHILGESLNSIVYKNGVKYIPISNKKRLFFINSKIFVVVVYDNKLDIVKKFIVSNRTTKVIIYHNAIVDYGDMDLKNFFINFPKYVGVVSNYCIDVISSWGVPKNKIILVKNILSDDMIVSSLDGNFTNDKYKICFIGNLNKDKRLTLVIDAVAKLHSVDKRYKLLIAGGYDANEMKKEHSGKKWILSFGNVNQKKLIEIYKESGIIVVSAINESFGRVSLEASLFGCIPIVNNSGGLPETVEDQFSGYIINKMNSEKIVQQILKINSLDSPTILNIRKNSANFARMYSDSNTAKQFIKDSLSKN